MARWSRVSSHDGVVTAGTKELNHMAGREGLRTGSRMTRRDCVRIGAIGLGGLTLPDLFRLRSLAEDPKRIAPRAKSVILLFLSGGPSQLDMWDMKPDAPEEIRGSFRPIDTNVPGIQVCEHLPRMAKLADKYAIVRSVTHEQSAHPA